MDKRGITNIIRTVEDELCDKNEDCFFDKLFNVKERKAVTEEVVETVSSLDIENLKSDILSDKIKSWDTNELIVIALKLKLDVKKYIDRSDSKQHPINNWVRMRVVMALKKYLFGSYSTPSSKITVTDNQLLEVANILHIKIEVLPPFTKEARMDLIKIIKRVLK